MQEALHSYDAMALQGPYNLQLFGMASASGARHELDGAAGALHTTILTEAKHLQQGITKDDICVFDRKTFDYYIALVRRHVAGVHYRVLSSATPVDALLRKYAFLFGITLVEPSICPLPILLSVTEKADCDEVFPEGLIGQFLGLASHASAALEQRYVQEGRYLRFDTRVMGEDELDDLEFLHKEFSECWLDFIDRNRPNYYEQKAEELFTRIGIT
ncbi:MAG: hypothetical protein FJ025_00995 [Chloroflexi bacterium]|nr:hypothetical protein [Chloroflexota bacterium]